jgi:prephenate dehydratase
MIYFQGAKGSFSWLAAKEFFGLNKEFEAVPKFVDLFSKIEENVENLAILPVENSLAGSVIGNYDLLHQNDAWVCGEVYLNIQHCLVATGNANLNYIEQVYSHPTALEQCKNFFLSNPQIAAKEFSNTALAAEFVSLQNNPKYAAIASKESANFFGLKIFQSNLEDDSNNWTRFMILKSRKNLSPKFENVSKASIAYSLKREQPGSLFRSLEPLAKRQINLVNIESRPILGKFFEYVFYVDFEFDSGQILAVQEAFLEMKKLTQEMKILGVYAKSNILNFRTQP